MSKLPRIDPYAPRGRVYTTYVKTLRLPAARWFVVNVAPKIDPWLFRVSGGRFYSGVGLPSAILETRGARSGATRWNPVLYFHDGNEPIIVAANLGQLRHPAWYHNLRAHPEVTLGGDRFRAEEVHDEQERARLWELGDRVFPNYPQYREMTRVSGRRIPIMRLTK